jgi:hypothetical protein
MCERPNANDARRMLALLSTVAALLACVGYATAPAVAQEREPTASRRPSEGRDRPHGDRRGPGQRGERRPGLRFGYLPGANLFRPLPEDEGPLTAEERVELMDFLHTHVPKVHGWLEQLRERDPAAFDERLQAAAPRLRQLRRIFERDPQLGQNLVRYSENKHHIWRAQWAWRRSADPEERRQILDSVRRWTAENLRIETAVLEDRANELERQREERVAAEVARWQSDDFDWAGESEEVRELVGAWRAAETDDDRAALAGELRRISSERIDHDITRLRDRAARSRENAVDEVDRRMQRWAELAERGPGTRPAARHERGRGHEDQGERGRSPGRRP